MVAAGARNINGAQDIRYVPDWPSEHGSETRVVAGAQVQLECINDSRHLWTWPASWLLYMLPHSCA